MPIRLQTYRKGDTIPTLPGKNLFHSTELFHVYEMTRGYAPVLLVASEDGRVVGKLLAVVRRSVRLFPPSIIHRCEMYGTGEYFDAPTDCSNPKPEASSPMMSREDLFGEMLEHLTREVLADCFLIEVRNLENPLFGYKHFQQCKYFSINWLRVHNSLHSRAPHERLNASRKRQIAKALNRGATLGTAESETDVEAFSLMLKHAYTSQVRKHFPDIGFFRLLARQNPEREMAKIFTVKYKGRIIGGSLVLYSGEDAYLLFSGGMRKTYAWLYPGVLAVWAALEDAHARGCRHFEFMDAGLPFKKFGYRDFILRFGGKQSSTRRWFRFRWEWLNSIARWLYR